MTNSLNTCDRALETCIYSIRGISVGEFISVDFLWTNINCIRDYDRLPENKKNHEVNSHLLNSFGSENLWTVYIFFESVIWLPWQQKGHSVELFLLFIPHYY